MSEVQILTAEPRQQGKRYSRAARANLQVPTVVYGPKCKNINILTEEKVIKKFATPRYESTIFTLKSENKDIDGLQVLFKNIDKHPLTERPVHLDLYALDMTAKVRVNSVIKYEGVPTGVKDEAGMLQTILNELEIECLPTNIPDVITVDISGLKLGDNMHVSDIKLPADVVAITSAQRTIVSVTAPKAEKVVEETAEAGAEGDAAAPAAEGDAAATPAAGDDKKS